MAHQKSEYENYLLVSDQTKMLRGTYPHFIKCRSLMASLNSMVSKQSNTYTYNGELYVSRLTNPEISRIQECLATGVYSSAFQKLLTSPLYNQIVLLRSTKLKQIFFSYRISTSILN